MSARIIPTLRYHNADRALTWLCRVLGFKEHLVHRSDDNVLIHAQLTLGQDMIMIGQSREDEYDSLMVLAATLENRNTQAPYIVVEELAQHYQRVKSSGAEIVIELREEDHGGAFYSCRDPEGNLWNFGSYDPWK